MSEFPIFGKFSEFVAGVLGTVVGYHSVCNSMDCKDLAKGSYDCP